jgi:RHS repeat-associated protein
MRTNERIYVGGYEIYREYKSGNTAPSLERQTLHVMDDKRRVVMVETKTIDASAAPGAVPATVDRYQFDNHLGSAVLELDGQAAIISYEEYYPYGSTAYQAVNTSIEASPRRYRYTGEERDDETGFNYQGARYYAPWLGRWTSCDPVVSSKSLPQALNRYCYANANPIIYSDPAGRQSQMVEALGEPFREAEASLKQGWEQVKQWASEDIEEWKHPLQSLGLTPAPDPSAAKPIPHSPAPAPRELSSFDWRPPSVEEEWRAMEKPAQARVLGGKLTVWESPELQETRQTIRKLNNLVEAGDVTGPY